jgi:hypothetical protein
MIIIHDGREVRIDELMDRFRLLYHVFLFFPFDDLQVVGQRRFEWFMRDGDVDLTFLNVYLLLELLELEHELQRNFRVYL